MPSNLNQFQLNINAIVSGLYHQGLRHVVICPGSRNAPLIMAFARFEKIKCYSIPDERSAGFIALGMAKALKEPVAVLCTSGSALVNIYPAVLEAFYMQVPLIVISADRPLKFIDRWDGQTIHQLNVFGEHVLGSFQTNDDLDSSHIQSTFTLVNDLYQLANGLLKGPVHLNAPLREPLYEAKNEIFIYPEAPVKKTVEKEDSEWEIGFDGERFFNEYPKVLILLGADDNFDEAPNLLAISKLPYAVVCCDVISNVHAMNSFQNWDLIFSKANIEELHLLSPDLLITSGKMVLNKSLKKLLRTHPPKQHWHIEISGYTADPFFSNPQVLTIERKTFFEQFLKFLPQHTSAYYQLFTDLNAKISLKPIEQDFNEIWAIQIVLKQLPEEAVIHLANSMTIRNFAMLMSSFKSKWKFFSNRGVSGIDGCTSTALGYAIQNQDLNILFTGDIAFFYDINALWNHYVPNNFKIVLMNNQGGGIFDMIDGSSGLKELNPFIKTPHQMDAQHLATHFKILYDCVENEVQLNEKLNHFLTSKHCHLLEIKTNDQINQTIFKQLKSK